MFVIVRHGNTFGAGEEPRRIGARTDLPLTPAGVAQGHALGRHFATLDWRFRHILVSPLARTRETARAILEHQPGAPAPEAADWLREIDHGPDEDQPEHAVLARIGTAALVAWETRADPPPGWTVEAEMRKTAWRRLFAQDDGPTLLVTSNGAARFALLACSPEMAGNLKLPTGGFGVIRKRADGAPEVLQWGKRP